MSDLDLEVHKLYSWLYSSGELYFVFLTTFVDVETLTLMRFDLFTFQGTQPLPYFKLLKQKRQGFYIAHVCVFVATRTFTLWQCAIFFFNYIYRDLDSCMNSEVWLNSVMILADDENI